MFRGENVSFRECKSANHQFHNSSRGRIFFRNRKTLEDPNQKILFFKDDKIRGTSHKAGSTVNLPEFLGRKKISRNECVPKKSTEE